MPDDLLLKAVRVIGLIGLALLISCGVGDAWLAFRAAQKIAFFTDIYCHLLSGTG